MVAKRRTLVGMDGQRSEPTTPEPVWRAPDMPEDVRRIGLDRNTVEGAWIEFASMLDRRKPLHLVVAWVLLALFMMPPVMTVVNLLF